MAVLGLDGSEDLSGQSEMTDTLNSLTDYHDDGDDGDDGGSVTISDDESVG